ncbi:type II secretion system minor pseudopilin GspJ [Edwardsiella tarda]|uniref:type II secretion system minor pseudopilin GspJ n=1 Tax=Edwardsiella tarda TaxID=636 RepID=UPI000D506D71|nr:type II secretion system minor pseudopilin GspJ [Edwardsiella tarda]UCQ26582.1 type II secretion system minor pseudopilin GspJ [Edwardsiella tarda]
MKTIRSGFTLLEMLVAIAIFASLTLMAQQVTNGITRVTASVAAHEQKLKTVQQMMGFMSHDLTQMMPRSIRGDKGDQEAALLVGTGVLGSESEGMRLVRGGVLNPLMQLPRSKLLIVGYRIRGGYLERLVWPLTGAAGSVKPVIQQLIRADSLSLQFSDGSRWQETWPSSQAIPVAVHMTLSTPQWGVIERIWLIRGVWSS